MSWILITLLAYFLLAAVALLDKYLISGPIPNPKVYAFYVGILGLAAGLLLFFIPLNWPFPDFSIIVLSLLAGGFRLSGLIIFFKALYLFEASRVVPAIGGLLPLFTFGLTYLILGGKEIFIFIDLIAFIFLVFGSVIITYEKKKKVSLRSFWLSALSAFLFALSFVLSKFVYSKESFWSGFVWIMLGSGVAALLLVFSKEVRDKLFLKRVGLKLKTAGIFVLNQLIGAGAFVLQNWAIALVPFSFLAFVNALEGTKYVFLLIFTVFLSLQFPSILKEDLSRKIIFQKITAILFIGTGLIILTLK